MKRLFGVLLALAGLAVLTMSHGTVSAQNGTVREGKQLLCHVSDDAGAHVIEVSDHAVPAHLANHGDCLLNSTDRSLIGDPCDPTDANGNDICDIQL